MFGSARTCETVAHRQLNRAPSRSRDLAVSTKNLRCDLVTFRFAGQRNGAAGTSAVLCEAMLKLRLIPIAILLLALLPVLAHSAIDQAELSSATFLHAAVDHPPTFDECGECSQDERVALDCSLTCNGAQILASEHACFVIAVEPTRFTAAAGCQIYSSATPPDLPPPKSRFHA